MGLAEDLFLLYKSVARGAIPLFFDIIAQNIPYQITKLFLIRTIPLLVHYCDLAKPLLACYLKRCLHTDFNSYVVGRERETKHLHLELSLRAHTTQ
jgi:hypothetical protein